MAVLGAMSDSDPKGTVSKPAPEQETGNIITRIEALERAREGKDDLGYKQRQLRFNKWLTILTGGLVLTSSIAIYFSITASDAAKKSADAATAAVSVAQKGLELNKESVEKTLAEMKAQSKAAQTGAEAAKLQASITKKVLESTIETSRLDQRAWVSFKGLKFEKELKAGELNPIWLTFINSGKTPARHFRLNYTSRVHIPGKPDVVRTVVRDEDLSLGPGREAVWRFDTEPPRLNQAEIDGLESGAFVLTISGEVTYQDIFAKLHKTPYCAFYKPELKPAFTLCPGGN